MRHRNLIFAACVLGFAALAAFVTRTSWMGGGASAQPPQRARVVSVELAKAERKPVPVDVDSIGTVTPISSVALKSRLETTIVSVHFEDGARVGEGDLLFTLDSRQLDAQIEQAEALLKPQRIEVLRQLAEPRTCTEVASRLGQTPQRVYYHVKRLVDARLVDLVSERKVRGIHEGIYQASARSYWLSPRLVGRIGLRKAQDEMSLGYLLDLMEEVQADVAALDRTAPELPSVGVSGEIRVRPEQRQQFLDDPSFLSAVVRFDVPRPSDIRGLRGLHPQCHIAPHTISLAPSGATMTGLDVPPPAVAAARRPSRRPRRSRRFSRSTASTPTCPASSR